MLQYTSTPIQEIHNKLLDAAEIRLLVKREDLNHPYISGNKWWKLKYNLAEAEKQNKTTLLTFGGAYSNHIYATAAAAKEIGFKSIGIIRGEKVIPLNNTLKFASECGMSIHYVSRDDYRKKNETQFVQKLYEEFGDFYMIPEGGSNLQAVEGCAEFVAQIKEIEFDYLCVPVGTGGTIAGIISGLKNKKQIIGFPVLKGADFLKHEIEIFLKKISDNTYSNWHLDTSYHHGGYAKMNNNLLNFIRNFKSEHNLPLDAVYTGKLLWAVMDYVRLGKFKPGSTVLAIHTGGLQGQAQTPFPTS